jgi:2-amino-4-hydroxy-6-hydroxymethyldihydropteridine diphosphokinase
VRKGEKVHKDKIRMIIALGSNQQAVEASPQLIVERAIEALRGLGLVIRKISRFYQTPCFPVGAGPDYVNAACLLETTWSPSEVIETLHSIEQEFGRKRIQRWGQRTLDLDLISVEDVVCPSLKIHDKWRNLDLATQKIEAPTELIVPHPRVQDRAFVLIPMMDIAPDWVHPILGLSVSEMLDALPLGEKVDVIPLNVQ